MSKYYCQKEVETGIECGVQCDHCSGYYKGIQPASAEEEAARMYPKEIVIGKENSDRFTFNQLAEIQRQAHIRCAGMYTGEIERLKVLLKEAVGPCECEECQKNLNEYKAKHNL